MYFLALGWLSSFLASPSLGLRGFLLPAGGCNCTGRIKQDSFAGRCARGGKPFSRLPASALLLLSVISFVCRTG